ncbi:zinc ribbon domain-containing protein [Rhodobaculum claviforme]|uniref:Primosomal protein N' (Replication factor Y) -superfamily II helicase n=1 Tax=Rhodobaculum claviforme TaxID=1549854 RepID=A0A934TGU5_9RHOB|nr:zinc ribbon domain-containing protein [Rhodobaculum claviforme]MBK5925915.1 primosomal protein N' (replication factor Y) - superfamily II helicase [Rhodobaculum claviforme]
MPPDPEEHRYPCDQCGAVLRFAPGQTRLICAHCGHAQDIPAADLPARQRALGEIDLRAALADHLSPDAMEVTRVLSCPACGAQVEFDPAIHASACPFCGTPVVTDTGAHRHIKPQAVVPFHLTEAQAKDAMARWLRGLWFAPGGLAARARKGRRLDGLYVPYWTFDAATASRYHGQRGDAYFVTRQVRGPDGKTRTQQVRQIRWTSVRGRVTRVFDDLPVMASHSLPRRLADGLRPWDMAALVPYRPDFLAGFRAEGYTVDLPEGWRIARAEMDAVIAGDVRRAIGGDEQRIGSIDTATSAETFKHVLLPIWMAAYRYRGRSFRFIVNAQTGRVQGERPWSVWKIAAAVLGAAAALGLLAYLGQG